MPLNPTESPIYITSLSITSFLCPVSGPMRTRWLKGRPDEARTTWNGLRPKVWACVRTGSEIIEEKCLRFISPVKERMKSGHDVEGDTLYGFKNWIIMERACKSSCVQGVRLYFVPYSAIYNIRYKKLFLWNFSLIFSYEKLQIIKEYQQLKECCFERKIVHIPKVCFFMILEQSLMGSSLEALVTIWVTKIYQIDSIRSCSLPNVCLPHCFNSITRLLLKIKDAIFYGTTKIKLPLCRHFTVNCVNIYKKKPASKSPLNEDNFDVH